jgi:multidrug resistance efflux pump
MRKIPHRDSLFLDSEQAMIKTPLVKWIASVILCLLFLQTTALAEDAKKIEEVKKDSKAPETLTIKTEPLKVEVRLKGFFEAVETSEIFVRPEVWSGLSVAEAAGHGEQVAADDVVLELDKHKIDVAVEDLELQVASTQLALEQAEFSLEAMHKSVPQDLEEAKRAADEAEENMRRFLEIERAETIKDLEQQVTSARNGLIYQEEELAQLEKMYKADDLTEETEEIILTRAQHGVDAAKYRLEKAISGQDRILNVLLPRQTTDLREAQQSTTLSLERAESSLPASLKEKELALEKQKIDLEKLRRKLGRTKGDRKLMTIRAPHEGTVYYGQAVRGQWPDAVTTGKLLVPGASVQPGAVMLTVVRNEDLFVRATAEEKQLSDIKVGDAAMITPTAIPAKKLEGTLKSVSSIPVSPGKFDAEFDFELDQQTGRIVAGMACEAVIEVYRHPSAILVPEAAVADGVDDEKEYVYLMEGEEKKQQRVRVGRHVGDRLEILRGLKPGDKILAKNPD